MVAGEHVTINHVALLMQVHKFGALFAAMRHVEIKAREEYKYVVRTRPDAYFHLPNLPHVSEMFAFYRDSTSNGELLKNIRTQFGGPINATQTAVLADIVTWDDQFAMMHRPGAEAYFLGAQISYTKCYNWTAWGRACGLSDSVAAQYINVKKRVPCCPVRLVSAEFDVVVRDCGDLKTNGRGAGQCERPSDGKVCLMTTDHWKDPGCTPLPASR
jgi:hypothetical protein